MQKSVCSTSFRDLNTSVTQPIKKNSPLFFKSLRHCVLHKKRLIELAILLFLNVILIITITAMSWRYELTEKCHQRQLELINQRDRDGNVRKLKTILFWNGAKRSELTIFGTGHDAFVQHKCPISDCEIVNSPHQYPERSLDSYNAILFNFNDEFWLTKRPVLQRQPHQRFIFFTQEPPPSLKTMNITSYDDYFNWTMTYQMDSDVRLLYGRIRPKPSAPETKEEIEAKIQRTHLWDERKDKIANRTRKTFVVAMISHCKTDGRREEYIKQLRKYIKVAVYGRCNTYGYFTKLRCDNDELLSSAPGCYNILESKYLFYLSFENSICPDYVTEKFFQIMNHNIVPVVYGGANYSRIAPAHSYIDALQYSPEELATYLKTLASNQSLYNEYFWWKNYYVVEAGLEQMVRHSFCDLCQKLHNDSADVKSYTSLMPYGDSGRCTRPNYGDNFEEEPAANLSTLNMLKYFFHRV